MTEPVLLLDDVSVTIDGRRILDRVSWQVEPGQHWVILGPNGGGKSTLLRVASLARHPSEGRVTVLGHELGRVDIRPLKSRIGVSSAALADQLRERLTAEEVVRCGRYAALEPWWHHYEPADTERANELLSQVGLARAGDRSFGTLSSGERQRVLLARSMMNEPDLVLLDEPTAGLDLAGRESLIAALDAIAGGDGPATALVTHHVEDIPVTTTHLLAVAGGRVIGAGPVASVLTEELLADLFGMEVGLSRSGGRWSARARPTGSSLPLSLTPGH